MSPQFSDCASNAELLARIPELVLTERGASAEVIAVLLEIDRRRLYLEQACSSLYRFAIERLGYSEDEALKRVRVARAARKLPCVLDELRAGAIHLTGLFLLVPYLTEQNADELLTAARSKSRREIEALLAARFPHPDVPTRVEPLLDPASAQPSFHLEATRPARVRRGPVPSQAPRQARRSSSRSPPRATASNSRPAPSFVPRSSVLESSRAMCCRAAIWPRCSSEQSTH